MKWVRRSIVFALAAVSLVAVGLWVRSYYCCDSVTFLAAGSEHNIWARKGRVAIESVFPARTAAPMAYASEDVDDLSSLLAEDYLNNQFWPRATRLFDYTQARVHGGLFSLQLTETAIVFPIWAIAVLFGVVPAIVLLRTIRRKKRIRAGFCAQCGYDLRASPDRCPECGTPSRMA